MLVARRLAIVSAPRADRWHSRPTVLLGGVALFLGFAVAVLATDTTGTPPWLLLVSVAGMCGLGLFDDVRPLSPREKLVAQCLIASAPVVFGVVPPLGPWPVLGPLLTLGWLVFVTNATNFLDNMDGLAAGTVTLSALFLAVLAVEDDNGEVAFLACALGGAALGFLLFNFWPARVFMGDAGSLALGYVLACCTAMAWASGRPATSALSATLALGVIIFDACLVMILRPLRGRRIWQGGKDHSSHRLVRAGLTDRQAVLALYMLQAGLGCAALVTSRLPFPAAVALATFAAVGLALWGRRLAAVPIGDAGGCRARASARKTSLLGRRVFGRRRAAV